MQGNLGDRNKAETQLRIITRSSGGFPENWKSFNHLLYRKGPECFS